MAMAIDPGEGERDELAGEYVLGTLDTIERASVEMRLRFDKDLSRSIEQWERRLDPLLDAIPAMEPSFMLFPKIIAAIERGESGKDTIMLRLRQRVRLWQCAAGLAVASAAALLLFIGLSRQAWQSQFVAVLETPDRTPAFVAAVDTNRGAIAVRRLGPDPEPGRSYELWAIRDSSSPESLGIVDQKIGLYRDQVHQVNAGPPSNILLAVTMEPQGGSPTGKPSGAPLYTGKLVQAPLRWR
jgi:anti-sigma-K factor RskA